MIRSFRCKDTQRIWQGQSSRKFPGDIQDRALRKLRQLDAAAILEDLQIHREIDWKSLREPE